MTTVQKGDANFVDRELLSVQTVKCLACLLRGKGQLLREARLHDTLGQGGGGGGGAAVYMACNSAKSVRLALSTMLCSKCYVNVKLLHGRHVGLLAGHCLCAGKGCALVLTNAKL